MSIKSKGLKGTSVTVSGTQKLPPKNKIVETYRHDHSLQSTGGALSDGTISFEIQPFWGKNIFSEFLSKNL
jgi:hypothetical protein